MGGRATAAGKRTKARLSSVANAMRLVRAFSDDEYEIGISNLARRLALPKSTVHRLATTLVDAELDAEQIGRAWCRVRV